MHFDVFNGDADGIIALLQLRLAEPKESQLITGVKRDIELLAKIPQRQATSVTVLDISMEKNQVVLQQLLTQGCKVFYADHHRSGDIPKSENLQALIDTDANICTSLIVNQYLSGQFVNWAIAAAFGDNLFTSAEQLAQQVGLSADDTEFLKALGIYINYNGYGRDENDLHINPADLFQTLLAYSDPLALKAEQDSVFYQLQAAYLQDMKQASKARVIFADDNVKVVALADADWARRVSGVFGNQLANESPDIAHAVLTSNADGSYTVSVRAPLNNKQGADHICSQFSSGGGRAAAAGINQLAENDVELLVRLMAEYYA